MWCPKKSFWISIVGETDNVRYSKCPDLCSKGPNVRSYKLFWTRIKFGDSWYQYWSLIGVFPSGWLSEYKCKHHRQGCSHHKIHEFAVFAGFLAKFRMEIEFVHSVSMWFETDSAQSILVYQSFWIIVFATRTTGHINPSGLIVDFRDLVLHRAQKLPTILVMNVWKSSA